LNICDLGFVDLQQGRIDSARHKLSLVESLLPDIIDANQAWATRIYQRFQSEVLLADGAFDDAIAVYKKFMRSSHDAFNISAVLYHNTPFITDGLARAYQHKGDITKAIAEYERLIGSELINVHSLIHPKLHYRLAKLYQEKGEREKAINEYEKFLDLWREADEDLPELIDAKKRFEKLKGGK
jgi:tetratricopeptide (TPR) repeat protein